MCGRFTLAAPSDELGTLFGLAEVPQLQPRYNIAPSQKIAAVRAGKSGRELVQLSWGLVPSWSRDPKLGGLINARGETVAEKASFRSPFRKRRCLVLADGFYEWQKDGKRKQPFYIRMKDGRPFAIAGLWERWTRGETPLESCTLITTDANSMLKPVHHRMPVILHPSTYDEWLDPTNDDAVSLSRLLTSYASDEMTATPVGLFVNTATNEDPRCIEPLPF